MEVDCGVMNLVVIRVPKVGATNVKHMEEAHVVLNSDVIIVPKVCPTNVSHMEVDHVVLNLVVIRVL
jgi:hypothetical protein